MSQNKVVSKTKDDPIRSLLKAISWRLIASGTTFLIVFVIFRQYSEQSVDEVLETASYITGIELVAKLIIYYLHERLWTNISWGKNWRAKARQRIERRQEKEKLS
jgi:uncharacterized membrane protein